jgi:uncharacterized protein
MEFNKVIRGAKRAVNEESVIYEILDAGFLCHVAFQHQGEPMMIPTAYGREGDHIYLHGSNKNFMFSQILGGENICISVTHLDGVVLAKSLFHTSVNYRSVILFGKAILVEDEKERIEGMKVITENIIKGRWDEVPLGTEQQINATMVVKFIIEKASAKIRNEGPVGDEDIESVVWSGHIPLKMKASEPIQDKKSGTEFPLCASAKDYINKVNNQ